LFPPEVFLEPRHHRSCIMPLTSRLWTIASSGRQSGSHCCCSRQNSWIVQIRALQIAIVLFGKDNGGIREQDNVGLIPRDQTRISGFVHLAFCRRRIKVEVPACCTELRKVPRTSRPHRPRHAQQAQLSVGWPTIEVRKPRLALEEGLIGSSVTPLRRPRMPPTLIPMSLASNGFRCLSLCL
jgi:hypothetical protein